VDDYLGIRKQRNCSYELFEEWKFAFVHWKHGVKGGLSFEEQVPNLFPPFHSS